MMNPNTLFIALVQTDAEMKWGPQDTDDEMLVLAPAYFVLHVSDAQSHRNLRRSSAGF